MKYNKKAISIFLLTSFLLRGTPLHIYADETTQNISSANLGAVLDQSVAGINFGDIASQKGDSGVREYIFHLFDILFPALIIVGVIVALYGGYKIMASTNTDEIKSGGISIAVGIIGILIVTSAKFIGNTLVNKVIDVNEGTLNGIDMATNIYEQLLYPFLIIAIYLSIGVLFFILASRVVNFMFSSDESIKKKSIGMIIRTVIGIAVILVSKELVEAVFGKKDEVLNGINLGEMGESLGTRTFQESFPIVYNIINWVMGLTALTILILIILQTIHMLLKPTDENNISKLKKTILYVFIGVIVIGAGYLITNVLIIDGQS